MTQRKFGTRPLGRKRIASLIALPLLLGIGCIDVGHETEIGCLKDMTEPGCTRGTGGSGSGGKAASGGVTTSSNRAGASGMVTSGGTAGNVGYAGANDVDSSSESAGVAGASPGGS